MSRSVVVRRAGRLLAVVLLLESWAQAQPAQPKGAGGRAPGTTAPSRVLVRGDREILTFETEEDYDRLEELERTTRDAQPEPGVMTPLYVRSNTDGSVQPYAVRLPREFARDQTYPLVVQLHGLNFMEVLSGSRVRYRGMGGPQWIESDLRVIYVHCFGRPSTFYRGT